jgi:hypothetical protein
MDIDTSAATVCELTESAQCELQSLRLEFLASPADLAQASGIVKTPGDRDFLDTDICPMESEEFIGTGDDLKLSIVSLEIDLAFVTYLDDLKIPEVCEDYRESLTAQTNDLEDRVTSLELDRPEIAEILYKLSFSTEASADDYEEFELTLAFDSALDAGTITLEDSGFKVLAAYNDFCDVDTLGSTEDDAQAIEDYNAALTYDLYIASQAETLCVARNQMFLDELANVDTQTSADDELLRKTLDAVFDFQRVDGALDIVGTRLG